jgi:hypothetical protein
MTLAIVAATASSAAASDELLPSEDYATALPCHGYEGSFEDKIPGFTDFWLMSEVGCERPGATWVVANCATGETLDVFVGEAYPKFEELRNGYVVDATGLSLAVIKSDLSRIGFASVQRDEPVSATFLKSECSSIGERAGATK